MSERRRGESLGCSEIISRFLAISGLCEGKISASASVRVEFVESGRRPAREFATARSRGPCGGVRQRAQAPQAGGTFWQSIHVNNGTKKSDKRTVALI